MKRLLKYIFISIFIMCCSFLICCEDNETSIENSSVNNETCNHDYIWNVVKEPTCTTYGEKTGICSICLEIKHKAIALIPHDYKPTIIKEATCLEEGISENICNLCQQSESFVILEKIPHDYSDGLFCKLCDARINPDFYVPDNFNGGITIKEIENQLALLNLSLDRLTQIELSSIYINYKGLVTLSFAYGGTLTSITIPDLQCNYAVETHPTSKISTLKITQTSQLNVYAINVENEESYIGSLNGTGKIQRLFINQNNDLFAVYNNNATMKIGALNADRTDEYGGLIYRKLEDKEEYAVIGLIATGEEHIKIPDTFKGLPVTLIDDYAFEGKNLIKSVRIGNHINTIGNWAFWKCASLQTIYLPNTSLKIRNGAFYETNLTTVYYQGNEDNKKKKLIIPTRFNELLFECTWIYNYTLND